MKRVQSTGTDYTFLSYIFLLLLFGLVMLTSASSVNKFNDPFFFITRQLLFGVIPGIILFIIASKVSYKKIQQYAPVFAGISFLLLLAVLIPGIGADYGTRARSWISFFGFSFQPAELAKLGVVIALAWFTAKIGTTIKEGHKGFLQTLGLGMIPVVLVVAQPDLGSAAIIFSIVFGILFIAGAKVSHLSALFGCAIASLMLLIIVAPYRAERLTTFLNPTEHLDSSGYHILQAEVAVGSGGWMGRGLGHSRQKHAYLPEVHADSIFAIIAEEMGVVISSLLVIFLLIIARKAICIAKQADPFGRVLVLGIIIWFISQSFFNIGSMLGIMPMTGVPLPFVSHGGTALMVALLAAGLIVNVSKQP